ncbi:MAG: hypothetical protein Q8M15_14620 [Bacteroidota bacterium]|nr:hypothetical protein [Bacteroidota bacterium]
MKASKIADPFLLRAIEHWLDAVNELTYQPIFCFWLTTQGYSIKFAIKNNSFEQGKDVVGIDKKGIVHAYQLKGGDINLTRWRSEVRPEIEVLIDIPVKHPEIDANKGHISYLVTNGQIEDSVRIEINDLNLHKWKASPLHIITRGDLLIGFQNLSFGVLPQSANSYKQLIDFIFEKGHGLPDIDKVSKFLYDILDLKGSKINKVQCKRNIAACVLYANMIVSANRKAENYVAIVQVMTVLATSILHLAEKNRLEDNYWKDSFDIIWDDIITSAKRLESDILDKGFEININSPFENELFSFRKHAAITVIYPLKFSEFILKDPNWENMLKEEVINNYTGALIVWSESSFASSLCIANILKSIPNCTELAQKLAEVAIQNILAFNGRNSKVVFGLPSPYYQLSQVLNKIMGIDDKPFDESFNMRSYYLGPLIDFLVRSNDKEFLIENWREISFMSLEEFVPDLPYEYLLWNNKIGINKTTQLPKQKIWSELVNDANCFNGESLPQSLKRFPHFIPFFMTVFPHRVNRDLIGFLSNIADKVAIE